MSKRRQGITCLALCLLIAGLLALPTIAQAPDATISMSVDSITETDAGFLVTGTVTTAGPVSEARVNRYYTAHVLAEIMETGSAQYPRLPDALRITAPEDAETAYVPGSGPGGTMTNEELHGVDITTIELASSGGPSTFEFAGTIPAQHAGKPFRIRAWLDYQVMYSGAMYPGITYKHAEGFSGTVSGTAPTSGPDIDTDDDADDSDDAGDAEDRKDPDTPYDISGDLDIDTPNGDIMDDLLGDAGDADTKPLSDTGEDELFVFSTLDRLEARLNAIQASLARDDLTDEERADLIDQRNELFPGYHQALREDASWEQAKIWASYAAVLIGHAADKVLTYNSVTGPVWSGSKAIIAAAEQRWGDMVLNASSLLGNLSIESEVVIASAGLKSQLAQDYIFAISTALSGSSIPKPKPGSMGNIGKLVDDLQGTHGKWQPTPVPRPDDWTPMMGGR